MLNPPTYDVAFDATTFVGDTIRQDLATNSGFTGATTEDHVLTSADVLNGTISFAQFSSLAASTLYYWRLRVVRGAAISPWSNTLNATTPVNIVAAAWVTVTSVNKSQFLPSATGSPALVQTGPGGGFNSSPCSVRATLPRAGKHQFELVRELTSTSPIWIGIDNGNTNYQTGFLRPGRDDSNGVSILVQQSSANLVIYSGGVAVQTVANTTSMANGDSLICEFDTVGGTLSVYRNLSGTITQSGTTLSGLSFASWYANCGHEATDTLTAKFGAGQSRALSTGYSVYDA